MIEHDRALNHKADYRVDSAYFIIMSLPQADKRSLISTSHLFPFLFGTAAGYKQISDMAVRGEWLFQKIWSTFNKDCIVRDASMVACFSFSVNLSINNFNDAFKFE